MSKSKYLWGSRTSAEGMVSVSQIQSFMSCPKKWEYGYVEGITPRVERPYLGVGKLCHKGMEVAMGTMAVRPDTTYEEWRESGKRAMVAEFDDYMANNYFLEEELPQQMQMRDDALAVFEQAFNEFEPWRYEVLNVGGNPALELHFVVPCTGSKGLHGFIDAVLRDKETGCVWCTDYKFRKTLAPDEDEAFNVQNAVYSYACAKLGVLITGTMTWQHINTPAADPQVLKSGAISRAKIKTTWAHYAEFCRAHGADPAEYFEEMVEKLADVEWFRSTLEYRNQQTVDAVWQEVIVPAAQSIKRHKSDKVFKSRSLYPWNCKMCQFKDLCQAELRGHDADFLRSTAYVNRDRTVTKAEESDTMTIE